MYLFRAANCTYYTRICLPKSLKDRGFPFDIKVSLLTKCRAEAVERNLEVARTLIPLIKNLPHSDQVADFKSLVDQEVDRVRRVFSNSANIDAPVRQLAGKQQSQASGLGIVLDVALDKFITSKSKESVRPLKVKQLKQRVGHFIASTKTTMVHQVTSAEALLYRDVLLSEGRSHKSNKEYLAASSQFFKWCKLMHYTAINPFSDIPLAKSSSSGASSARQRWQ